MKTKNQKDKVTALAAQCVRIIEWSTVDHCFVGSAPPLLRKCCHADTAIGVATQLETIIADVAKDVVAGRMPAPKTMAMAG